MIFAKVQSGNPSNIEQFPYNLTPQEMNLYQQNATLPENVVVVDTETNKPADDWTKNLLHGDITLIGDSYVLSYTQTDRYPIKQDAVDFLIRNLPWHQQNNEKMFEHHVNEIVKEYPEREISSWDQQVHEAKLYKQELVTTNTPLLEAMATTRGIDVGVLADRILANALAYAQAYGQLLGQKHKNDDIIKTLQTDPENEANWPLYNQIGW